MEAGRARALAENLNLHKLALDSQAGDKQAQVRDAVSRIQTLQARRREEDHRSHVEIAEALAEARRELKETLGQLDLDEEVSFEAIGKAAEVGKPLVYLSATSAGGLGLIIHRATESSAAEVVPVWLDRLTDRYLHRLLVGEERDGSASTSWFGAYSLRRDDGRAWRNAIERTTFLLWDAAMGPILARLEAAYPDRPIRQITLVPTGLLALLPLHAAWDLKGDGRVYALDTAPISYAPSARVLIDARKTAEEAETDRFLGVYEPRPTDASPLPGTEQEVIDVSKRFSKALPALHHEEATVKSVLEQLATADVVHFACHGLADMAEPLRGGLLMAGGHWLTVADLLKPGAVGARLAVLSACETGMVGTDLPDEAIALPTAFLQARYGGAVGSLWEVGDKSTTCLMTKFYALWRTEKGVEPAIALCQAQRWLRDETEYDHPLHWAPFYYSGA